VLRLFEERHQRHLVFWLDIIACGAIGRRWERYDFEARGAVEVPRTARQFHDAVPVSPLGWVRARIDSAHVQRSQGICTATAIDAV
jgi:hypothetical protein